MGISNDHHPVTRPSGKRTRPTVLPEQFTLKNATIYGGANLIWRFLEHIGVGQMLTVALDPHRKAKHAKYSLVQEVLLLLVGRMLGLGRIADFTEVEEDPLLARLFGCPSYPT